VQWIGSIRSPHHFFRRPGDHQPADRPSHQPTVNPNTEGEGFEPGGLPPERFFRGTFGLRLRHIEEMRLALSVAGSAALLLVGIFALFTLGIVHGGNRHLSACPTPTQFPSQSPLAPGITGAAGMQLQTAQTGVPYVSPTPPIVVAGHMTVRRENAGQTVTVPPGTVIDVLLVNGSWSTPTASGGLTPVSTQRSCNGDVRVTFRANHSGQITSEFDTFEVGYHFVFKVLVTE
jgi:hypothetical protein